MGERDLEILLHQTHTFLGSHIQHKHPTCPRTRIPYPIEHMKYAKSISEIGDKLDSALVHFQVLKGG